MRLAVKTTDEPLRAIRGVVDGAEEVLMAVAFVQRRGVNLLEHELRRAGRVRLVATTVFGTTTAPGLEGARGLGADVRVLNPAGGSYHPKLYVARHGDEIAAANGSANLTGGLIANLEAVTVVV